MDGVQDRPGWLVDGEVRLLLAPYPGFLVSFWPKLSFIAYRIGRPAGLRWRALLLGAFDGSPLHTLRKSRPALCHPATVAESQRTALAPGFAPGPTPWKKLLRRATLCRNCRGSARSKRPFCGPSEKAGREIVAKNVAKVSSRFNKAQQANSVNH